MKRLNLQIDNKMKKTKGSFFDYDASEVDAALDTETVAPVEKQEPKPKTVSQRKFKAVTIVCIAFISVLLIASVVLLCIDFSDGALDGSIVKKNDIEGGYYIVPPDWETNIYSVPEYLELDPDFILFSMDGKTTVGYRRDDVPKGSSIEFIQRYIDAIKMGDNKTLNNMFGEGYIKENGEFSEFPMQKLYNIKVRRLNDYIDKRYEGIVYDYEYYEITYNIYLNDGYFCSTVDEETAMVEGIMVIFDEEGNGKIEFRRDLRPYK